LDKKLDDFVGNIPLCQSHDGRSSFPANVRFRG
jgi:hypothetical protein